MPPAGDHASIYFLYFKDKLLFYLTYMIHNINTDYICIEGNIGTGKTSFATRLANDLNSKLILEQFDDNPFLPYFYENPDRYAFSVELFFLTERFKQLEAVLANRDLFYSGNIADYTFPKSMLFSRSNLSAEEYRLFQNLYHILQKNIPQPSLLIYLHRPVGQLLQNIQKRGRTYEQNITAEYLIKIQNTYFEYFQNIVQYPALIVDVTELDFVGKNDDYLQLKDIISRKYLPGLHSIRLM